jgi:hypothetical protein
MGLLDNLKKNLSKGYEYAREKGELGARVTRVRLDILNLNRERDVLFARLGRSYYFGRNDSSALEPIVRELERVHATIRDRESVLAQLLQPAPAALPAVLETDDKLEASDFAAKIDESTERKITLEILPEVRSDAEPTVKNEIEQ